MIAFYRHPLARSTKFSALSTKYTSPSSPKKGSSRRPSSPATRFILVVISSFLLRSMHLSALGREVAPLTSYIRFLPKPKPPPGKYIHSATSHLTDSANKKIGAKPKKAVGARGGGRGGRGGARGGGPRGRGGAPRGRGAPRGGSFGFRGGAGGRGGGRGGPRGGFRR